MPNFKPKASKKIVVNKKSIVTLDSKHNEKMNEFLDISNNILPSLRTEKHFLKKQLKTKTDIGEKLEIKDRIIRRGTELGYPNLYDMIADETIGTTEEEILPFLQEKGHPALSMDPIIS